LIAGPSPRPRSRKAATVSASALAQHLDCSQSYIGKLEAEGVIQRQGDGFPLDQSRVAYLRYLRREHQRSPRTAADAEHVKVKTEMLQLRLQERRGELMPTDEAMGMIEEMVGLFLTRLSSLPAKCAGRDLAMRHAIERAVYDLRKELSERATRLADQYEQHAAIRGGNGEATHERSGAV
jgi:hypothetical protein